MYYWLAFFSLGLVVSVGDAAFVRNNINNMPTKTITTTKMFMAPKYDGTKWISTLPEDGPDAGYPPTKTLLLHGPKPYLTRIFQPDDYEQAVLKFMASDKVNRIEAQGNMDAYLR